MNSLRIALVAALSVASSALADYRFDVASNECRNDAGELGLNAGVRGPCADLRQQDLEGVRFDSMDLRGASFDGANLKGASFLGAELSGASFRGANLNKASLRGAKLSGARFENAKLINAQLEHARLDKATFANADLRNACLFKARFDRADVRSARFSQDRSLVDNANWVGAIVAADTLPFTIAELATLNVQLMQVASR